MNPSLTINPQFFDLLFAGLVEWSLRAGMLLALASLASFLLRKKAAALRHILWVATFTAILCLPLLTIVLPEWRVIPSFVPSAVEPLRQDANLYRAFTSAPTSTGRPSTSAQQPTAASLADHLAPVSKGPGPSLLVVLAWLTGTLILSARFELGLFRLKYLERSSSLASSQGLPLLEEILRNRIPSGGPLVFLSAREIMPLTWGLFSPRILLPRSAASWSARELDIVLKHELAHIQRKDWATKLLVEFVFALLWFHPLVWIGRFQFLLEQERACDEAVVHSGDSAADYADTLLRLAARFSRHSSGCVGIALGWQGKLESRIRSLLLPGRAHTFKKRQAFCLAILSLALALPIAAATLAQRDPTSSPPRTFAQQSDSTIVGTWIGANFSEGIWTFSPDGTYSALFSGTAQDHQGAWNLDGNRLRLKNGASERLLETLGPASFVWSYPFEGKTRHESFRKQLDLPRRTLNSDETELVSKWTSRHGMFPATLEFKSDGTFESGTVITGPALSAGIWNLKRAALELITLSEHDAQPAGRTNRYATLEIAPEKMLLFDRESQREWHYTRDPSPTDRTVATSRNAFNIKNPGPTLPAGEIQGQVFEGSKPLPGAQIIFEKYEPKDGVRYDQEIISQADGTFSAKNLPPGKYRVSRLTTWNNQTSEGVSPTATGTHSILAEVRTGRTTYIQIGGTGRSVKGQLVPSRDLPKLSYGDIRFLTLNEGSTTYGGRHIVLRIQDDGTFQAPDVPAGEYKLYVTAKPFHGPLDAPDTVTFSKMLVVPPGEGVFELGTISNN